MDEIALHVLIAEGVDVPTAVAASQCEPERPAGNRRLFDLGLVLGVVAGLVWICA